MAYLAMLLAALMFATSSTLSFAVPSFSYEALETLVNMDALFTIKSLKDNAVPMYRKDLPQDYVAYWEVIINDRDFAIVSAGPDTGDYKLIYEGRLPTFTSRLNRMSRQRCARYLMFAPDAGIICEDVRGNVVAVNLRLVNWTESVDTEGTMLNIMLSLAEKNVGRPDALNYLVMSGNDDAEKEFERRAKEVKKELVWADVNRGFVRELGVGETVKLPVILPAEVVAMEDSSQGDVCTATGLCEIGNWRNKTAVIDDALKSTSYGVKYVEFEVKRLGGQFLSFRIGVNIGNCRQIWRRFATNHVNRRVRRSPSYVVKSVPHENLFPSYDQFVNGKCFVGSAAVAWASVFAYLNRRSHSYSYYKDCENLYRDGNDGTNGSNAKEAPKFVDNRMKRYIIHVCKMLRTSCFDKIGVTSAIDMDNIASFYTSRVNDGKIRVSRSIFTTLVSIPRAKYRDIAINIINRGYPAIIGWRITGNYEQHYPIATRYRWKDRKLSRCTWLKCTTVREKEYQFYLHMGWGGSYDGWYAAKAYMTAAVVQ